MSYLMNLTEIEKTYGVEQLFKGFSLGIEKGDKIGVIGPNGAGKSTLLKIIAGKTEPDKGEINRIKGLNCVYLEQDPEFDENLTSGEIIGMALEKSLGQNPGSEGEIRKIIGMSGYNEYDDTKVSTFSGGMKKKLALTCAMMELPDILLLDEPTNHLDLEGIEWLENIISTSSFSFIAVSHDREFLNNCSNKMIEISPVYPGCFFIISGGYDDFLKQKNGFLEKQTEMVQTLSNKMRREDDWLSRSPKARTTKARFRIDSAHDLRAELSKVKARDSIELSPTIEFESTGRKTKRLIVSERISKSYEDKAVFNDFSLVLQKGDRFSVVGPNGSGKTTLIDILSKKARPDSGKIHHVENLKIVYFDQKRGILDRNKTPKEILAPESDSVIFKNHGVHIISWLKRFGIDKEQMNQPVHSLSGGEQARVMMADLVRTPCDIIFLDEPTNDLDIPTIEMLEDSLVDFEGTVFVVTHDRYFARALNSKYICLDGKGKIGVFHGLDQWKKDVVEDEVKKAEKVKRESKPKPVNKEKKSTKLSYKYQRELDNMEDNITKAETLVEELEERVADPELYKNPDEYANVCRELKDAQDACEALYERWEYLEAMKNGD